MSLPSGDSLQVQDLPCQILSKRPRYELKPFDLPTKVKFMVPIDVLRSSVTNSPLYNDPRVKKTFLRCAELLVTLSSDPILSYILHSGDQPARTDSSKKVDRKRGRRKDVAVPHPIIESDKSLRISSEVCASPSSLASAVVDSSHVLRDYNLCHRESPSAVAAGVPSCSRQKSPSHSSLSYRSSQDVAFAVDACATNQMSTPSFSDSQTSCHASCQTGHTMDDIGYSNEGSQITHPLSCSSAPPFPASQPLSQSACSLGGVSLQPLHGNSFLLGSSSASAMGYDGSTEGNLLMTSDNNGSTFLLHCSGALNNLPRYAMPSGAPGTSLQLPQEWMLSNQNPSIVSTDSQQPALYNVPVTPVCLNSSLPHNASGQVSYSVDCNSTINIAGGVAHTTNVTSKTVCKNRFGLEQNMDLSASAEVTRQATATASLPTNPCIDTHATINIPSCSFAQPGASPCGNAMNITHRALSSERSISSPTSAPRNLSTSPLTATPQRFASVGMLCVGARDNVHCSPAQDATTDVPIDVSNDVTKRKHDVICSRNDGIGSNYLANNSLNDMGFTTASLFYNMEDTVDPDRADINSKRDLSKVKDSMGIKLEALGMEDDAVNTSYDVISTHGNVLHWPKDVVDTTNCVTSGQAVKKEVCDITYDVIDSSRDVIDSAHDVTESINSSIDMSVLLDAGLSGTPDNGSPTAIVSHIIALLDATNQAALSALRSGNA